MDTTQRAEIVFTDESTRYSVQADVGRNILHEGLSHQIPLRYECASGSCGSCTALLVDGTVHTRVDDNWRQVSSSPSRGEQVAVHLCQSRVAGNCTFASSFDTSEQAGRMPGPTRRTGRLIRSLYAGANLHDITLVLDDTTWYLPGQYLLVETREAAGYRAYSIAGGVGHDGRLDFVVSKKPGGIVSNWLCDARNIGEPVTVFGPLGKAFVTFDGDLDVVMVVGGSGIAVAMSVLRCTALADYLAQRRLRIYWGVRDIDAVALLDFLNEAASRQARLDIAVCSDKDVPGGTQQRFPALAFTTGYPVDHALTQPGIDWTCAKVHVTGPPPMVNHTTRTLLVETDIDPSSIQCDSFF